ncbi:hypothetical protein [Niabella beijingensis]|uniref:hypothetical protein n=1 Tax=Niabella beijingensis TaxID=2872700 RepID=UPI001CC01E49|nr:hypothetical protein [Niabella beijingensis]MBZ4189250.1 hypothetical protein [Niabella beijingensis]
MKRFYFFLYLFIAVGFSSCYELIEEVAVQRNGSGSVRIILNCSESKTKIAAAMLVGRFNDFKIPDKSEIRQNISKVQSGLSSIPGISDVTFTTDYNAYVAVLKFSFSDVGRINEAVKTLAAIYKISATPLPVYSYDRTSGVFEKKYTGAEAAQAAYRQLKQTGKDLIDGGHCISVCRFAGPVKSWSNTRARLLNSKSGVVQRFTAKELVSGNITLSNKIQLSSF